MKYEKTAKRIRQAMDRMKYSQQELADKCKIGKSSISHYVNGTNEPGNKTAYILAQALNVNPAWLMGFDVDMEPAAHEKSAENFQNQEFIDLYTNADPDVQKSVVLLLKAARHDS